LDTIKSQSESGARTRNALSRQGQKIVSTCRGNDFSGKAEEKISRAEEKIGRAKEKIGRAKDFSGLFFLSHGKAEEFSGKAEEFSIQKNLSLSYFSRFRE